jgi:hypothetical protein
VVLVAFVGCGRESEVLVVPQSEPAPETRERRSPDAGVDLGDVPVADGGGATDGPIIYDFSTNVDSTVAPAVDAGPGHSLPIAPVPRPGCDLTAPLVLAQGIAGHRRVVVDDMTVYYLSAVGPPGIYSVPKAGGTSTPIAGVAYFGDVGAYDLAVDAENIYIMDFGKWGPGGGRSGGISVQSKSGAASRYVNAPYLYPCQIPRVWRIAVVEGEVYFIQSNTSSFATGFGCDSTQHGRNIMRAARGGTTAVSIASVWDANAITADAAHVFWTSGDGAFRANRDGSGVTPLTTQGAGAIAADASQLWLVAGAKLFSVPAPMVLVPRHTGSQLLGNVVVDGVHAYVGGVAPVRVDADGNNAIALGDGPSGDVAIDDRYLYYFRGTDLVKTCR